MALAAVPPWTDQNILLYHGTSDLWTASILHAVDLKQAQPLTDFGRGFYTTTKLEQATRWANSVAHTWGGSAAVIEFDIERNALAKLECLFFIRSDTLAVDFWSFVQYGKTIPATTGGSTLPATMTWLLDPYRATGKSRR